jgi:AcrR family transcriptional regulator
MDNRTLLLDWAVRLFAGRGYDAVGIQEICLAARVTKPTLYYYFTSKRGLLQAVLERDYPALLEDLRQAASYQGDLGLNLEQAAQAWFGCARQQPLFYRLLLALYFAPPESEPGQAAAPYRQEQHEILETLFIQAARQHPGLRGRQRTLAASFNSLVQTWAGFYFSDASPLNDAAVRQVCQQFLHGVL